MNYSQHFIDSALFEFRRYKKLGDDTFSQLSETDLQWSYGATDNSIALIVKHMAGNMRSRWTNFLSEDGEKTWRQRETEFESAPKTKKEILSVWESGWACLFDALHSVNATNFNQPVRIRTEKHSIVEAVHRQLAHYAHHVGQIVFIGKMIKGDDWVSLSIAKGGSESFNKEKFKNTTAPDNKFTSD